MNRGDDIYSSIRSVDSIASRSLAGGSAPHMSGVGIFFQQEGDSKVYAKTIVSGGSAERDGRVRVGDVICGVDGRDVIGEPASVLRSLLLGHEGSSVVLTFARAVDQEVPHAGRATGRPTVAPSLPNSTWSLCAAARSTLRKWTRRGATRRRCRTCATS